MTQSQCFDAILSNTAFANFDLNVDSSQYTSSSDRPHNAAHSNCHYEPPTLRRISSQNFSFYDTLKIIFTVLSVVFLIFNLPFILSIGYDMLLTLILLIITPFLYSRRYVFYMLLLSVHWYTLCEHYHNHS